MLAGVALAVLTTWPLVLHLPSRIAPDLGDPVRTAWEVAWVGHAMLHDPLHLFNSNAFYPHPLSLAFSDSLLGYGPAAFFGSGTVAALVRYNLLFLFAWSLCFVGAYLLARELGLGRLAGAVAGAAFAYAPYRVTEAGHLHVISSGGIPLALFLLLRGYRRGSRGLVLAGWLVSAWQISLGFTLGLQYSYLLLILALLVLWSWWRRALPTAAAPGRAPQAEARTRGPLIPRRLLAVTCIGIAVLGVLVIYQARPYLRVVEPLPDGGAHDQGSEDLLLGTRRPAVGVLGEPRLGLGDGPAARTRALQERGRVLPGPGHLRCWRWSVCSPRSTRGDCGSGCSSGW